MTALTTTYRELRRSVGYLLGDVMELTATVNGSTTTFTDTINMATNMERPNGREIVFTSGANAGLIRRITTSDMGAGTLTFAAVTSTVAADTAELYNFRLKGWKVKEYRDAINRAINEAWPLHAVPVTVAAAAVFSDTTTAIDVPAGIDQVESVEYSDTGSLWQSIPQAHNRYSDGWSVEADGTDIVIRGAGWRSRASGRSIRLVGWNRATPLTAASETDSTTIPPEWLIARAASILCLAGKDRDPNNYNTGLLLREDADKIKHIIRTRRKGRPVMVA